MRIDQLKSFVAVAECEGFSAAARALNMTQSAVSLQIKQLEEQSGARLFERSSRSVSLTAAGDALLPYARRILYLRETAQHVIGKEQAAALRFGITEDQAAAYLPSVLSRFRERFPQARLEIICNLSNILLEQLHTGLLDATLTIRHGNEPSGAAVIMEKLVWVGATDLKLLQDTPLPLVFSPEGCVYRRIALNRLARDEIEWNIVCVTQSPRVLDIYLQKGLALSVKPPRSIPPGCRIFGAQDGLPELDNAVVELHSSPNIVAAEHTAFLDMLVDTVKTYAAGTSR
jgi:DNA-binding transcriptional LysR family regulator